MGDSPQIPHVPEPDYSGWVRVISIIEHPLAFFALVFLGICFLCGLARTAVDGRDFLWVLAGAAVLILILGSFVALMTFKKPENLTHRYLIERIEHFTTQIEEAEDRVQQLDDRISGKALEDAIRDVTDSELRGLMRKTTFRRNVRLVIEQYVKESALVDDTD